MTPLAELHALHDAHGVLRVFATAARAAAHVETLSPMVRERVRVARYVLAESL